MNEKKDAETNEKKNDGGFKFYELVLKESENEIRILDALLQEAARARNDEKVCRISETLARIKQNAMITATNVQSTLLSSIKGANDRTTTAAIKTLSTDEAEAKFMNFLNAIEEYIEKGYLGNHDEYIKAKNMAEAKEKGNVAMKPNVDKTSEISEAVNSALKSRIETIREKVDKPNSLAMVKNYLGQVVPVADAHKSVAEGIVATGQYKYPENRESTRFKTSSKQEADQHGVASDEQDLIARMSGCHRETKGD